MGQIKFRGLQGINPLMIGLIITGLCLGQGENLKQNSNFCLSQDETVKLESEIPRYWINLCVGWGIFKLKDPSSINPYQSSNVDGWLSFPKASVILRIVDNLRVGIQASRFSIMSTLIGPIMGTEYLELCDFSVQFSYDWRIHKFFVGSGLAYTYAFGGLGDEYKMRPTSGWGRKFFLFEQFCLTRYLGVAIREAISELDVEDKVLKKTANLDSYSLEVSGVFSF